MVGKIFAEDTELHTDGVLDLEGKIKNEPNEITRSCSRLLMFLIRKFNPGNF